MEQLYIDLENYLGISTESVPEVVRLAIAVLVLGTIFLLIPILTIWVERKVAARFQNRIGPNRTGPYGLLQSLADVLKLIGKEQIMPAYADRIPFLVAPMLMVVSVIMITAVIPLMPNYIGADLSIGALYFVAIGSLSTIAVVMAGWGSNNKYALLGAFRTVAQLISYEIPLVFSLLVPVLFAGTMSMVGITQAQANLDYWYIFLAPASFLIFLFSNLAEIGRTPFDLLEAESELVAGYQIEYSAMPWGMFMLSEFLHAFLIGPLVAVLFLGGWDGPFAQDVPVLGVVYLVIKSLAVYFLGMWMRATLPRFRIDQLMEFNWKFLVPLSIANLLVASFLWELFPEPTGGGLVDNFPRFLVMGGSSLFTLLVGLEFLRRKSVEDRERIARLIDEKNYPLATADQTGAAGD